MTVGCSKEMEFHEQKMTKFAVKKSTNLKMVTLQNKKPYKLVIHVKSKKKLKKHNVLFLKLPGRRGGLELQGEYNFPDRPKHVFLSDSTGGC